MRIGGWSPLDLLHQQAMEQARELEEGVRVAYVAATRARDLLVVPAVGDAPFDGGWVSPLDPAIYPPVASRRQAAPAPAARRSSATRCCDGRTTGSRRRRRSARGCTRSKRDAREPYDVVWWDPAALHLGVEAPFGLRRQELIARDVAPEVVAAGQRAYIEWRDAREAALTAGAQPSVRVRTATEWALASVEADATATVPVEVVTLDSAQGRPSGTRFGTLVHAVLATRAAGRERCGHPRHRVDSITRGRRNERGVSGRRDVVEAALRHPLFDAARAAATAGRCLRETPVTLTVGDELVEGTVDFAFDTADGTTVIDFKTDRVDGVRLERYRRQVGLYAEAIARVHRTTRPRRVDDGVGPGTPPHRAGAAGTRRSASPRGPDKVRATSIGVQRRDSRVEIRDRLFEHRPMSSGAGPLQVGKRTRAREHQRGPLGPTCGFFGADRWSRLASRRRGFLLRLNRLAFPASSHQAATLPWSLPLPTRSRSAVFRRSSSMPRA